MSDALESVAVAAGSVEVSDALESVELVAGSGAGVLVASDEDVDVDVDESSDESLDTLALMV